MIYKFQRKFDNYRAKKNFKLLEIYFFYQQKFLQKTIEIFLYSIKLPLNEFKKKNLAKKNLVLNEVCNILNK